MSSFTLGELFVMRIYQRNGHSAEQRDEIRAKIVNEVGAEKLPANWESELLSAAGWASSSFEAEARAVDRRLTMWKKR